jgi:PAS domain S-box-containing protein
MRNARRCYLRWGALAKVQLIDRHHPPEHEEGTPSSAATIETRVEQLDLWTVMKAAQAVSSEIVLGKLIDTLMRTAIEDAGAQRGVLILMEGDEPRFAAEATTSGDTIVVRSEELHAGEISIPESVLQYVVRSEQIVLLEDASAQNLFTETYFREGHARSILCLPLIHQTKLIGALYLENNLAARVFTPGRIGVLKLLASQAAISLENSRLYADLETREAKIRRLVEANIVGIFIWNLAGEIIEANDAFLQMIGYDRGDLEAGRLRWKELLPQEWPKAGEFGTERADATKTVQAFETEYVQKNGRRVLC